MLKPSDLRSSNDEDATDSGVIVRSVAPGSSCESAGVEPGWSLEAADDVDVSLRSSVAVVVAEIAAADEQVRLRFRAAEIATRSPSETLDSNSRCVWLIIEIYTLQRRARTRRFRKKSRMSASEPSR